MHTGLRLVGRNAELAVLTGALDALGERGVSLLVTGDAGSGKTALAEALGERARTTGATVLTAWGVPSESHVPYAALHQLLDPLLDPQPADGPAPPPVLLRALGSLDATGPAPDEVAVGLATLTVLRAATVERPVVLVVDDVEWVDASSARVLAFVTRRTENDPVAFVCTGRERPAGALAGVRFTEVVLGPLDDAAAADAVGSVAPGLDPALRERLLREAAGNPLALVELARAWQRLPSGTLVPGIVPVTARLETTFADRADALPAVTRDLLLLAAVHRAAAAVGDGTADLVAAARRMGHPAAGSHDLGPAADAGLVHVTPSDVRFRHPLVRAAVWHRATEARLRVAHAALADVLADPDRGAWHRAASLDGPDEDIAAALERAADRAARRGAVLEAVETLERAAQVTPAPAERGRRLVLAAYLAADLGQDDVVTRLLDEAEVLDLTPAERARAMWRRYRAVEVVGDFERMQELVSVLYRLRDTGATETALESLGPAADVAWWRGVAPRCRDLFVGAARTLTTEPDARLLCAIALTAPVDRARDVRAQLAALHVHAITDPGTLSLLGRAACAIGDQDAGAAYLRRAVRPLREQGRLGLLNACLVTQAWACWHLGRWDEAEAAVAEAQRVALLGERPTAVVSARLAEAVVAAARGDAEGALRVTEDVADVVARSRAATLAAVAAFVRGSALLGLGRADEAYDVLREGVEEPATDASDAVTAVHQGTLPAYIDAALRAGQAERARAVVARFERVEALSGSPMLSASLAYARPLVADDEAAEPLFEAALTDLAGWPFLRARVRLAYGTWLRRRRRIAESRSHLRAARDGCDALRATPWGDRARQELRAAGESAPARPDDPAARLTAQELEIARLAAAGLTNREIGGRLFLSPRTVGSHLYHLFPKLGITSRAELARVLPAGEPLG